MPVSNVSLNQRKFFSVCYDIERPWNKYWWEVKQKDERGLTREEKRELERRKYWQKTINSFVDELRLLGARINWSVYLIPEIYKDEADEVVDRYKKKFNELRVNHDIYILEYASNEENNQLLLDKVIMHMKNRLLTIVNNMEKAEENDEKNTMRYLKRETETILKLAKVFTDDAYNKVVGYYNELVKDKNLDNMAVATSQVRLEDLA